MGFCRTFESDSPAEVLEGQMHSGVCDLVSVNKPVDHGRPK
jgi:hypothetical protein